MAEFLEPEGGLRPKLALLHQRGRTVYGKEAQHFIHKIDCLLNASSGLNCSSNNLTTRIALAASKTDRFLNHKPKVR